MTHLIDKAAVVAEINRVLNSCDRNEITIGRYTLVDLRDFLDTLGMREVDLEKEIDLYYNWPPCNRRIDVAIIAKHFFALGLKAQKGGKE